MGLIDSLKNLFGKKKKPFKDTRKKWDVEKRFDRRGRTGQVGQDPDGDGLSAPAGVGCRRV